MWWVKKGETANSRDIGFLSSLAAVSMKCTMKSPWSSRKYRLIDLFEGRRWKKKRKGVSWGALCVGMTQSSTSHFKRYTQ